MVTMETLTEKLKIDRQVLEDAVATAASKNNDIFEMLSPFIEEFAEYIKDNILGDVGYKAIDSDEELLKLTQRVICRYAFANNISSLDLVLTATGFGIVSTQDTAPASQARVQELKTQVFRQYLKSKGVLIEYLRKKVEGWGDTMQAEDVIRNVFYNYNLMANFCSQKKPTMDDWLNAQSSINGADLILRKEISDEEMDELLDNIRHDKISTNEQRVIYDCRVFTAELIKENTTGAHSKMARMTIKRIVEIMERHLEDFSAYKNSETYTARHFEDYENSKDSPVFFFNG